ncbi:MAG: WD40 repeat domain-containing serine/threonine protein kinase [Planctomycetota bacterium]|jgi:WD40 repeat protein
MNERRIKELFERALDAPESRRTELLADACGPTTRRQVERLLDAHARVDGYLERPAAASLPDPALDAGCRVGNYRIVGLLGAGGGGTIYEAVQESPRRHVALKVMAGGLPSSTSRRRFREEAELLARLQHPGIATVFEAGVHEGLPYFALEFVKGARSITRYAREEGLDGKERLALFARVCDAVHYGHQKGIIHRDLKPGNVLVDARGNPRVIDFGIARQLGRAGRTGELVGTLPYMSPEQCQPDADIDVRCDVYALGVLLYELLHERLPCKVKDTAPDEVLRRIREGELRAVDRAFRGDVEAILHRALARQREDRYASAAALADDVRRHLTGFPVEARGGGPAYQLSRFARRHRGSVLAALAFVLVLAGATVVAGHLALEKERQRHEAEVQAYVANIAAASAALRVNDVAEARQRLELAPPDLRRWEWSHLWGLLDGSEATWSFPSRRIFTGAASPHGSLAAAGNATRLWAWDTAHGQTIWDSAASDRVDALAFDADGRRLAVAYRSGGLELRAGRSGAVLSTLIREGDGIIALAFAPGGERIAVAGRDGRLAVHCTATGSRLGILRGHTDRLIGLCFDREGRRLATASRDGTARLWDLHTSRCLATMRGHRGSVEAVALDETGQLMATCSRDRTVRIWSAASGELLESWHGHTANVRSLVFVAGSDATVATASYDSTLRLWRRSVGEVACLRGHTAPIMALARQGDGIVSFARDGTSKRWNPAKRDAIPALRGHADAIVSLRFDSTGRWLASASRDGSVVLWDVRKRVKTSTFRAGGLPSGMHFPDPETLWTLTHTGVRRVWSIPGGQLREESRRQPRFVVGAAGRLFGAGPAPARLSPDRQTWEWLRPEKAKIDAIALDAGGARLALGLRDGAVVLREAAGDEALARTRPHRDTVTALAFHPGGQLLASCSRDGTIALLDADSLEQRWRFSGLGDQVADLAFSPDGSRLATCGSDQVVRIWDLAEARLVATLTGHANDVLSVAWSPDGRMVASGEGSVEIPGIVRLWTSSD